VDPDVAQGAGRVKPRDVVRVVVTQALFAVGLMVVTNARRHDWELAALGEVIAAGRAGVLVTLLITQDR